MASHASHPGFQIVMNEKNLGEVGPFFSKKYLVAWVEELVQRLGHAAIILLSDHEGEDRVLLATRKGYLDSMNKWRAKYLK
jgi:hypothetical protein